MVSLPPVYGCQSSRLLSPLTPMPWSVDANSSGNPLAVAVASSSMLIRLPRGSGDSLFLFFPSDGDGVTGDNYE